MLILNVMSDVMNNVMRNAPVLCYDVNTIVDDLVNDELNGIWQRLEKMEDSECNESKCAVERSNRRKKNSELCCSAA